MAEPSDGWVALARVVKTQGCRGELACDILTDIEGRFDELPRVSLCPTSGQRREFALRRHWFHKGRVVLGFEGIEDMTAAQDWIGAEVQVPRAARAAAPAGSYFLEDLVGCAVFDHGRGIGAIASVEAVAGAAPLLHVADGHGNDVLVPFVEAFLVSIALPERRVDMILPEGLLDVNAPLGPHP